MAGGPARRKSFAGKDLRRFGKSLKKVWIWGWQLTANLQLPREQL